MMWDTVMERVIAEISANTTIASLYTVDGKLQFRMASPSGKQQVPGIEWTLIGDTEAEVWEPLVVQFDMWYTDEAHMRQTERIIRNILRQERMELGGLRLLMSYVDGVALAVPDRANFYGRGIRFRIAALRERYAGNP